MDFTGYPMDILGAVVALLVFGIFLGTWWWYAIRAHEARALVERGSALLVDIDEPEWFDAHPVRGARNVPLRELEAFATKLGSMERPIVVCGRGLVRGLFARHLLRKAGFRVQVVGEMGGL